MSWGVFKAKRSHISRGRLTTGGLQDGVGDVHNHLLTHVQRWLHDDVGNAELDLDLKPDQNKNHMQLTHFSGCDEGAADTESWSFKIFIVKKQNGNYNKSFSCQGKEQITAELQDPFWNWAVVKMREALYTFAKIQSHLHYLWQLHQLNIR